MPSMRVELQFSYPYLAVLGAVAESNSRVLCAYLRPSHHSLTCVVLGGRVAGEDEKFAMLPSIAIQPCFLGCSRLLRTKRREDSRISSEMRTAL